MTKKLFYNDAYQTSFDTQVVKNDKDEEGRDYVVLEETAFYPTGGGQPFDEGTLNEIRVDNVEEVDGEVRHYVAEPLDASTVNGVVDWARRFDHMQQHSGQHILSAIMQDEFGMATLSFHLGAEIVSIDLDATDLTEETLEKAEERVNEVIRDNRPIETKWMTVDESNQYPLRKKLAVDEAVRLVVIPDVDYNGCGGTHPRSTGEVQMIKLLGWSRQKKIVRLEFVCGNRVLEQLGNKHKVLNGIKGLMKRPEEALEQEVSSFIKESKQKDKQLAEQMAQLLEYEARDLASTAGEAAGVPVIERVYENRTIKTLQDLGKKIVEQTPSGIVVLVSEQKDQLQYVLAQGANCSGNMKEAAEKVMPLIEAKGGGKPNFVQGGGTKAIAADAFAERLREAALETVE
ncbi:MULTISPECIES: alanyl-tRNA editing protein [Pontibacillus]|uniref:DHHA1 domain-containing protein n=1 Tax=Pontibacillus chungwhensis TaxID=265426 RepID=A0ABY8UZ83_9BACI|nr:MULTISPECIES: DHHA1 domain-containing protein [Pontibacillus]MCD5324240.1 DHHA1 domain-containing protein [Pontibacillus sp. HN14]WIF97705.1 DHHA1 domain-containing protein [Pontibacillus chungwhensis]